MMPVEETIIRTKSIHLVRESVHLSEFPNFTIYGCGKLTIVLRSEKRITLITFNIILLACVHVSCMYVNNYIHLYCKLLGTC